MSHEKERSATQHGKEKKKNRSPSVVFQLPEGRYTADGDDDDEKIIARSHTQVIGVRLCCDLPSQKLMCCIDILLASQTTPMGLMSPKKSRRPKKQQAAKADDRFEQLKVRRSGSVYFCDSLLFDKALLCRAIRSSP